MSEGIDAWVSRPEQVITPEIKAPTRVPTPTGASAPQPGLAAPPAGDRLPSVEHMRPASLWVLGTHGGAGESTVAALSAEWRAAEHAWPQIPGQGARVLLTARSNMHGLRAAQTAATQWAAGLVPGVELMGLVIVHDAPGKLPRALRDRIQVVSGGVPRTWSVPWNESWRLGEEVSAAAASREVRRLVSELNVLTGLTKGTK